MPYYGRFKTYFWRKGMDYNLNKEREKRLEKTGKWFEAQSSGSNKDIYLTYLIPLLLIVSLCATIFVAIK